MSAIRLTEQGADPRPDPTRTRSGSGAQAQAQATRPAYPPILAYGVTELESMIRFSYQIALGDSANRTEMEIPK